jgi:hypothetical protein
LSQRNLHLSFPSPDKGASHIYGGGGGLVHRAAWKVKSEGSVPKILGRAGPKPTSIPSAEAGATWESTECLANFRQGRAAPTSGEGMARPHGAFDAFAPRRHRASKGDAIDTKPDLPIVPFASREAWEAFLEGRHATCEGLWLEIAKKGSGIESVTYETPPTTRRAPPRCPKTCKGSCRRTSGLAGTSPSSTAGTGTPSCTRSRTPRGPRRGRGA